MPSEIVAIDPRLIVNNRGVRPVTSYHANFLKDGFRRNGYISTYLITCRNPTAREIVNFYVHEPHFCDEIEAEERAQAALKQKNGGGFVYCIDGLHRRKVALELMEAQEYSEDFRLLCRMVKNICAESEIALSISLNSSNEYSIRLSPCALLLQCSRYDQIVNSSGRKKLLSAAEVGRRMVQCNGSDKKISEKNVRAMAETRRQVIGICRKLPVSSLRYLDCLQETNPKSAEAAFSIANLKAIPRMLKDEEAVAVLKRMSHFYKTQIPIPKAMPPNQVNESIFYVRRAIKAIESFKTLCEYSKLPNELEHLAGQMKDTDKHDEELADCSYEGKNLYPDLAQECEKHVPGGALKLMIARKKIAMRNGLEASKQKSNQNEVDTASFQRRQEEKGNNSGDPVQETRPVSLSKAKEASRERVPQNKNAEASQLDFIQELSENVGESEQFHSFKEPPGWKILNCSIAEFEKRRQEWSMVEACADFAIFDIWKGEKNQDAIDKIVRHIGSSLKVTGVAHAFCSPEQFSQVLQAATTIGLTAISCPMVYVADAEKTRRLTYSLQPQEIVEYAAIFYKKSSKASEKHFFSASEEYENSITPPWTNVVSNISPCRNRLIDAGGKPFELSERSKGLYKYILRQWCRPGGLCYNPLAKTMVAGLAAYEIGIRYVAIEADQECFDAAKMRILQSTSCSIKRTMNVPESRENSKPHPRSILSIFKKAKPLSRKAVLPSHFENDEHVSDLGRGKMPFPENPKTPISPDLTVQFPDRQVVPTDSESDESHKEGEPKWNASARRHLCAAAESCLFKAEKKDPSHVCGQCRAPVHNLCEYGKRVEKDFSREQVFACSKQCFILENKI